jgi:hypothetical protein
MGPKISARYLKHGAEDNNLSRQKATTNNYRAYIGHEELHLPKK